MLQFGKEFVSQPCVTQDDIDRYLITNNKFKFFNIDQFLHVPYSVVFALNNLFLENKNLQQEMKTLTNRFAKMEQTVKYSIDITKTFDDRIKSQQLQIIGVRQNQKNGEQLQEQQTFLTQQQSSEDQNQKKKQKKTGKLTLSNLSQYQKIQNGEDPDSGSEGGIMDENLKKLLLQSQQNLMGVDGQFNSIQKITDNENEINLLKEQINRQFNENQVQIQQVIDQQSQATAKIYTKMNEIQEKIPENYKKENFKINQDLTKNKSDIIDLNTDLKEFKKNNLRNIHTLVDSAKGKMLAQVKEIYKDIFDEINKKIYLVNKDCKTNKEAIDTINEYNNQQDEFNKKQHLSQQEEFDQKILKVKYDVKDIKDTLQQNINENFQNLNEKFDELDKNQQDQKALLFKHNGQIQKLYDISYEKEKLKGNIDDQDINKMFQSDSQENIEQNEKDKEKDEKSQKIENLQIKINNKYFNSLDPIQRKIQKQLNIQNKPTNYRDQNLNIQISSKQYTQNYINGAPTSQNRNKQNMSQRLVSSKRSVRNNSTFIPGNNDISDRKQTTPTYQGQNNKKKEKYSIDLPQNINNYSNLTQNNF